ncbi:MAG TPA: class I SAM-dependent methyltransferase [bacterium]|nr:class I SAM-dependent methyltransferase [bacterium]
MTNFLRAVNSWDQAFAKAAKSHSAQNLQISRDFLSEIRVPLWGVGRHAPFRRTIAHSRSIFEFGCGTGDLSKMLRRYTNAEYLGVDISQNAIDYANARYSNKRTLFMMRNILETPLSPDMRYDLAIASNVLEHFLDPWHVCNVLLSFSKQLIVLVPYRQSVTDGYEVEGGLGHVFCFDEIGFQLHYYLLDWFVFRTAGWTYSSRGEIPQQMAVLITKKDSAGEEDAKFSSN